MNALPAENNYLTLRVVRDIKRDLGVTEAEFADYEIVQEGDQLGWNAKAYDTKPFKIGSKARKIIKEALLNMDANGKLTEHHVTIYEIFVKGE